MAGGPAAFMSYVRFDDAHDDGQLSRFRERLANEVRMQTGEDFTIFQDRTDIVWGQPWRQRITQSLDSALILLVIVTPGLFRSQACREEMILFRQREQALGREDLIFPVYYVSARAMEVPGARGQDWMAQLLWSRQYADWRDLRFEPMTSPSVRRAFATLATRIQEVVQPAAEADIPRPLGSGTTLLEKVGTPVPFGGPESAAPRVETVTHLVDASGEGDFTTVGKAITAASPGDRILVRPGLYRESLVIDKPLEILGDGPVADIQIQAPRGSSAVQVRTRFGRVANLTVRQDGAGERVSCVTIQQGWPLLEDCDISSLAGAGVLVGPGADPVLRRNRVRDGAEAGVVIANGGLGTLVDNEITGNARAGIEIAAGGNPMLRRNHIHHNRFCGVQVGRDGLGLLEDNEIVGNAPSGVMVTGGGHPVLRGNRIHDNEQCGVHAYENGRGTLEDNEIAENGICGVAIEASNLTIRRNRINRNGEHAIRVTNRGAGTVVDNDLTGNLKGAWRIKDGCEPNVARARNAE